MQHTTLGFCVLAFVFWLLCFGFCVLAFVFWLLCFGFCDVHSPRLFAKFVCLVCSDSGNCRREFHNFQLCTFMLKCQVGRPCHSPPQLEPQLDKTLFACGCLQVLVGTFVLFVRLLTCIKTRANTNKNQDQVVGSRVRRSCSASKCTHVPKLQIDDDESVTWNK
jgi:hypothetical protein